MTIPRELKLLQTPAGVRLASQPIKELDSLLSNTQQKAILTGTNSYQLDELFTVEPGQFKVSFSLSNAEQVTDIVLSSDKGEYTKLQLNPAQGQLVLDRRQSGLKDFEDGFASLQTAPLQKGLEYYDVEIWVDKASVEVFVNKGVSSMTSIVFPTSPYNKIQVSAEQPLSLSDVKLNNIAIEK
jgi:levanase/fructan beta-fructosidase